MKQRQTLGQKVRVFGSHSIEFATAHFYRQSAWSAAKNEKEFGACARPYGHGHNYKLHAVFEFSLNPPDNGRADHLRDQLEAFLKVAVKDYDHHHISFEHPTFSGASSQIPTTENMALDLMKKLVSILKSNLDVKIVGLTLHENEMISAEVGLTKRAILDRLTVSLDPVSTRLTLKSGESFQVRVTKNSYVAEKARESNSLAELCLRLNTGSEPVLMINRTGHFFFAGFFPEDASGEG